MYTYERWGINSINVFIHSPMSDIKHLEQKIADLQERVTKLEARSMHLQNQQTTAGAEMYDSSENDVSPMSPENQTLRSYSIWAIMGSFGAFFATIVASIIGARDTEEFFAGLAALLFIGGFVGLIVSGVREGARKNRGDIPEKTLEKTDDTTEATKLTSHELDTNWEMRFGGNYMAKIGMGLVCLGVVFFLKWSFDNGLIGPLGRIIIGFITGIAFVLAGERWSEKFKQYAMVLVGGGFAILYFTVFAARFFYNGVVPVSPLMAFAMLVAITGAAVFFAIKKDSKVFGFLALGGGFISPFLMNSPDPQIVNLLSYILLLDIAVLVLAAYKRWASLSFTAFILSFFFTVATYYDLTFAQGAFFLSAFFTVFLGFSIIRLFGQHKEFSSISIAFAILTPLFYYGQMLGFLDLHQLSHYEGLFTLGLAALYVAVGSLGYRRQDDQRILQTFYGTAITFVTIAIALEASGVWITVLWTLEGAILFYIAQKNSYRVLEVISSVVLAFALLRFWGGEFFESQTDVIANSRFAVGMLLTSTLLFLRLQFPKHVLAYPVLFVIFISPLLLGFAEIDTFYDWKCVSGCDNKLMQQGLTNSLYIIVYAIGLFYAGILRRLTVLRKASLIMFLFAVTKVLLWDLWELGSGYRIASFIILGLVLLGVGYWYQNNQDTLFSDKS